MKRLFCISFLSVFSFYLSFVYYDYNVTDLFFLIPNYCLSLFCLLNLLAKNEYSYSFNNVFYIFHYFFFGIAPVFQYIENVNIWGGVPFTKEDYVLATFVSLIALIIYSFLSRLFRIQREKRIRLETKATSVSLSIEYTNSWILVIVSFALYSLF